MANTTTLHREGTGTRDWVPPTGEMRPSSLGACPRYAWENARIPEDERPFEPVGRQCMMHAGHAAEHKYFELQNVEFGANWTLDYELDNGFGGICHPDGLDFDRRVVAEIKFTSFKSPAPYHLAQISYYIMRMTETTGEPWTGEVVLLDKHGGEPKIFPVDYPSPEEEERLLLLARAMMHHTPPPGICQSAEQSQNVKYYDALAKPPRKDQGIICPMAAKCFPPPDDDMEVS